MWWSSATTVSLGLLLVLAGCLGGVSVTETTEQADARLGSVGIRNVDSDAHTVDILVEKNGTIAYWSTRRVAGKHDDTMGSAVLVPGQFVDQPGRYVVSARLDNATTGERIVLSERGCYVVGVRIEADATLSIFTASEAYECRDSPKTD